MNVTWLTNVQSRIDWRSYDLTIPAQAYMDDTSFMGRSREDIQASVNIANQFYSIHDIFINGKKCDLIVINPSIPKALRSVTVGQDQTIVKATNNEIRYLGIWISDKQSKKKWMRRLQQVVNDFLNIVKKKKFGVGHLAYIINRVLIPKLMYVSQLMTLYENDWDIIFRPVLKMIKYQLSVARSFPSAAIFHEGLTGIDNPWHVFCANQVANFTQLINGDNIASSSTILRLRYAQLDQLMTYPIWQLTRQDMNHMKSGSKNNLALHSLIIARSMDIEFHVDHFDLDQWTIKGGGTPLRPYILATQHYTWFKKLRVLTRYPVFFTDQLFTDRTQPVTWRTLKELNGLSTKGRQALWFQQLISAVVNPELKVGSDAIQEHCPYDPLKATILVSPDL